MTHRKYILLIGLLIVEFSGFSQGTFSSKKKFTENWMVGVSGGLSYLATELNKDYTNATMDMNSTADVCYSLSFAKMLSKRFDVGVEYNRSYFSGFKKDPSNVNWLMKSVLFNNYSGDFQPFPIYYKTNISSYLIYGKFNFLNIYTIRNNYINVNFYAKVGLGVSLVGGELGFTDESSYAITKLPNPLYKKGKGENETRNSYFDKMAGIGMNYGLNSRITLYIEGEINFVNVGNLDGVHNYDSELTQNMNTREETQLHRIQVYDVFAKLSVGVAYNFSLKPKNNNNAEYRNRIFNGYSNPRYTNKKFNRTSK